MPKKTTRPLGKGTRNLSANVSNDLYADVVRQAGISGCSMGEYIRTLVHDAVLRNVVISDHVADHMASLDALRSGHEAGTVRKVITYIEFSADGSGHPISRTVEAPTKAGDEARVTKAVDTPPCPPPTKFVVHTLPKGFACTTAPSGPFRHSVNESEAKPTGPRARSTQGIKKATRSGQVGEKSS